MHNRLVWGLSIGGAALFTVFRVAEFTAMRIGEVPVMAATRTGDGWIHGIAVGVAGNIVYNSVLGDGPPKQIPSLSPVRRDNDPFASLRVPGYPNMRNGPAGSQTMSSTGEFLKGDPYALDGEASHRP